MSNLILLSIGLVFLVTSLAYITINKNRRDIIFNRLHFQKRRVSYASTPPRSLSPGKQSEKGKSVPAEVSYKDVFPPSRRCALKDIGFKPLNTSNAASVDVTESPPDSRTACVPLDVPISSLDHTAYTCTEFSTEEIEALGDFPDYATLSGVPLPNPYPEFRIETAKPRPYRPFRWTYHQTMCKNRLPW